MNRLLYIMEDEKGATAIEYALIAAFIATVIVSAVTAVGTKLAASFNGVASNIGR